MANKMKYYVICDKGNFDVKCYDLLTEKDMENIVYGPCTAVTACLEADKLEEEYINKHHLVDTTHYFENIKYKSSTLKPLNKSDD